MPIYVGKIPSLWDRADGGITNPNGTYTPPQYVQINSTQGSGPGTPIFEEMSDSPQAEFAEQATITHKFQVDYATGVGLQLMYPRGTLQVDSLGNESRVLSTVLQPYAKTNAQAWMLTMVSEGTSWGNPPDEFSVSVVQLNPVAEKHPRYSMLSYLQRNTIRNAQIADYTTAQQMQQIASSFSSSVQGISNTTVQEAALELMFKKQKGEDTFYCSAYLMQYSQYFWQTQQINPGGFIQDPVATGAIPATYVLDTNGVSIFSQTAQFNPNLFPNYGSLTSPPYGLSWLRQTDQLTYNRTWYRLTKSWIGAPIGQWDNEWYNGSGYQPYQSASYQGGINVLN